MKSERDPYGKDPHTGGSKLDAGKRTFAMTLGYFPEALALVDKVSRYGATKYSHGGWKTVPDGVERYTEANLRHVISSLSGEECDPDTGFLHKAHAAWNALAALELALAQAEVERLEKLRKPIIRELYTEATEARMDVVGQNGNTAEHYPSDEWIPSNGQEPDLLSGTRVDIRFADGNVEMACSASSWIWERDGASDDITHYRIHQPE